MPNISDRLDAVIEKLDGMTSETVEKNLDTRSITFLSSLIIFRVVDLAKLAMGS